MTPVLGPAATLRCPTDDLEFRPYYTDGRCPLCGWQPAGVVIARPWTHRADWVWIAFGGLVLVSAVMALVVFAAL